MGDRRGRRFARWCNHRDTDVYRSRYRGAATLAVTVTDATGAAVTDTANVQIGAAPSATDTSGAGDASAASSPLGAVFSGSARATTAS